MIKNYFLKLIKGEIPLNKTFWIWFVLVSLLIELVSTFILTQSDYYEYDNKNQEMFFYSLILIYGFIIFIAVFKSANKYLGSKVWAYLSKIIVTVNLFLSVSVLIETFQYYYLEDYSINQEIQFYKDNLPIRVDSNTELIDIDKSDKTINYVYKFYNISNFDSNEKKRFKKQVQNSLCDETGTLNILKKDYILKYSYVNVEEKSILDVITDKKACGKNIYDLDILREILAQRGEL